MMNMKATNTVKTMTTMTTSDHLVETADLPRRATIQPQWHTRAFSAMNTSVYLWQFSNNAGLVRYVERLFARNEQILSRFLPESDLSRLNRNRAKTCRVSSDLFNALEQALWFARRTGGLYDPAILPILERLGYDRSFEKIEASIANLGPLDGLSSETGPGEHSFRAVLLDRLAMTVSRPVGMRLDLGGMGKGWTVDRAADLLHGEGPFFLNAGGDIYAGGAPDHPDGWVVEIEDPLASDAQIARVRIRDRALATSTIVKRSWRHGNRRVHHLIDPRRGDAAETDVLSATVIADRTVVAEVLAKTALILGPQGGLAFVEDWPDAEALLYTRNRQMLCTPGFEAYLEAQKIEQPR